jgi:hypothetical protein
MRLYETKSGTRTLETSIPATAEVAKQSIATAFGLYQNLFAAAVRSTALR